MVSHRFLDAVMETPCDALRTRNQFCKNRGGPASVSRPAAFARVEVPTGLRQ
jgi:hypothetical protein